jgi:class 3 adenylate cyclase
MDQRTNRTFICSVLFMDIVEYSKKSVEEQITSKERFNTLLSEIIKDIAINDRIILDTGDGAAIGFMGDPEDALFVAMELRDSIQSEEADPSVPLSIRMGINLGPVKLLTDINKQLNLIGDGINVAQRVMSFADPGQLLVSRSYYEVISCLSQEYAKLFNYTGLHADKHVREHGIYSVGYYQVNQASGSAAPVKRKALTEPKETPVTDHRQSARNRSGSEPAPVQNDKIFRFSGIAGSLLAHKWLYSAISLAAVIVVFIAFIWRGDKGPTGNQHSAIPAVTAPVPKTTVTPNGQTDMKKAEAPILTTLPAPPSVTYRKAADIGFLYSSAARKGFAVTFTVMLKNAATDERSVALYDDNYRWPKSCLTDTSGRSYEVREVYFLKAGKRIPMHETGKTGIPIDGGETVMARLTFKKISDNSRRATLHLHPFIYQGWRWTEHELNFPDIVLK